jgi:hypothetical protein
VNVFDRNGFGNFSRCISTLQQDDYSSCHATVMPF